jgi:hypothetical protein
MLFSVMNNWSYIFYIQPVLTKCFFCFFSGDLGFELRASHLLSRYSYHLSHSASPLQSSWWWIPVVHKGIRKGGPELWLLTPTLSWVQKVQQSPALPAGHPTPMCAQHCMHSTPRSTALWPWRKPFICTVGCTQHPLVSIRDMQLNYTMQDKRKASMNWD